jgi:hypothetical protein
MVEWRYSSTITVLGIRWRWIVSFTPLPLYPWRKSPRYPLYRRLVGLQSWSGRCGEEKNLAPPRDRNRAVQPVTNRYTDWATLAPGTMVRRGKRDETRRETCSSTTWSATISLEVTWDWTRGSVVKNQHLTTCVITGTVIKALLCQMVNHILRVSPVAYRLLSEWLRKDRKWSGWGKPRNPRRK